MQLPTILIPIILLSTYSYALSGNETLGNETSGTEDRREDEGPNFGEVVIKNSCDYNVNVQSVGAWPVGGDPMNITTVLANDTYREVYRETCPWVGPRGSNVASPPTCPSLNKMSGQAISIKISRTDVPAGPENILQLEYALMKNPERGGDTFLRLDYDISLLNCAQIENITEAQAKEDVSLNQKKIDGCPGYQNGLALWTERSDICRPIYCDGENYCDAIYNYERSWVGESSFACDKEYRGNLNLELCVGNGDGSALEIYNEWAATGTTASILPSATATPDPDEETTSCIEEDITITSTTTIQTTITISSESSTTTTYPISCAYDPDESSEVCWSQMPPRTMQTVTVTETEHHYHHVTDYVTKTVTKHITKLVTVTRGNGTYAATGLLRRRASNLPTVVG